MTLVFRKVNFEKIMELSGNMEFPQEKIVVLYGANQQGKTNLINAIRYAFLREAKRAGRHRPEYDEWALPSRKELALEDEASIEILFEHNKRLYALRRKITKGGKREESVLQSMQKPAEKLDVEDFLKNRLKVSLMDALFTPEIVGGFKRLYSGNIDESIAEMFKDITAIRSLVTKFIQRIQNMKRAAEAELVAIERNYGDFYQGLAKLSPQIESFAEFEILQKFEVGKTVQKFDNLHGKVQGVVSKLTEERVVKDLEEAKNKAKELGHLKNQVMKHFKVRGSLSELRTVRADYRKIRRWLRVAERVTRISDKLPKPPPILDSGLKDEVEDLFNTVAEAKSFHKMASQLAAKSGVQLETIPQRIKELSSVTRILKKKATISKTIEAALTEVERKAYAVVPVKLLVKHPSLTDISKEPIPKGTEQEKKQYLSQLKRKIETLTKIKTLYRKSETKLQAFLHKVPDVSSSADDLKTRAETIEKRIQQWSTEVANASASFLGKKVSPKTVRSERDVDSFAKYLTQLISRKETAYLDKLNENFKELGISVTELSTEHIERAWRDVMQQKKELPGLAKVLSMVAERKSEWQKQEEVFSDYKQIPGMADAVTSVLRTITERCFDERKLKDLIANTYDEIMKTMGERNLTQAILKISPEGLKGSVTYKDKPITHPAGSEKAFFSLAILTALAHYFQAPVLIDEVANNLDTKNLKAFFELVREFKERWGVQYVLSVKETNDFVLEGWVRELRDDIKIYELSDKAIREISA